MAALRVPDAIRRRSQITLLGRHNASIATARRTRAAVTLVTRQDFAIRAAARLIDRIGIAFLGNDENSVAAHIHARVRLRIACIAHGLLTIHAPWLPIVALLDTHHEIIATDRLAGRIVALITRDQSTTNTT